MSENLGMDENEGLYETELKNLTSVSKVDNVFQIQFI